MYKCKTDSEYNQIECICLYTELIGWHCLGATQVNSKFWLSFNSIQSSKNLKEKDMFHVYVSHLHQLPSLNQMQAKGHMKSTKYDEWSFSIKQAKPFNA